MAFLVLSAFLSLPLTLIFSLKLSIIPKLIFIGWKVLTFAFFVICLCKEPCAVYFGADINFLLSMIEDNILANKFPIAVDST